MTKPEQIIEAFDEILDFVYGRSRGRDYAAKDDLKYAKDWVEQGLTVPIASAVFFHRMSMMHERWCRNKDPHSKENYPAVLKVFDENIIYAINRKNSGGVIDTWEIEESRWKARIKGFYSKNLWNYDLWGPSPVEAGCRAPACLLSDSQQERKTTFIK